MLDCLIIGMPITLLAFYIWKKNSNKIFQFKKWCNVIWKQSRKKRIIVWTLLVIGYGLWLLWNFWGIIIFPKTPITLDEISSIIFHPPFIQLVLAVTFAWLIVALLNVPNMRLKGINTPFLKFEMGTIEQVAQQVAEDVAVSRENDETRWIAVSLATKVLPFNDVDPGTDGAVEIDLIATAMGGIILDAFRTVDAGVEFTSGIIEFDDRGFDDDILYFPPDAQYVMRNAYRENMYYFKDMSLAVPVRYKDYTAIFYSYNSSIKMYKMDCMMVETIWAILLKNIDTSD